MDNILERVIKNHLVRKIGKNVSSVSVHHERHDFLDRSIMQMDTNNIAELRNNLINRVMFDGNDPCIIIPDFTKKTENIDEIVNFIEDYSQSLISGMFGSDHKVHITLNPWMKIKVSPAIFNRNDIIHELEAIENSYIDGSNIDNHSHIISVNLARRWIKFQENVNSQISIIKNNLNLYIKRLKVY